MSFRVNARIGNLIALASLIIAFVASLPELFLYRGVVLANLGVTIELIFLFLVGLLMFLKVFLKTSITERFFLIYSFVFVPMLIGLSIAISLVDTFTYANFVYSNFHLDTNSLFDLSFLFLLFSIPFLSFKVIKKHIKWGVFTLGIILFYLFVFLKWRVDFIFFEINGEDEILEYAQFFLYLASSFIALLSFRIVRKLKIKSKLKVVWLSLLAISALGLFIIATEEISWGQRILDIQTPDTLKEINRQDETNIHNIDGVFNRVYDGYLIVAFYGLVSWLVFFLPSTINGIKLKDYLKIFLSRWYLAPLFLVMIGYVLWRYNGPETGYHLWEEIAELFFATGVFSIFLLGLKYLKNIKN